MNLLRRFRRSLLRCFSCNARIAVYRATAILSRSGDYVMIMNVCCGKSGQPPLFFKGSHGLAAGRAVRFPPRILI